MSRGALEPERIVVGVSQSSASSCAVLWAAQEARIRRTVLLVTHIDPPTAYALDRQDAASARRGLLAKSATIASDAQPSVAVGTLLLSGAISDELIRLSRSAALIVVAMDRDIPGAAPGAIGSIAERVVVQAHCPVVTVSAAPPWVENERRYVAVGWSPDASGARALAAAAAEADVRGVPLTVMLAPIPNSANDPRRSPEPGRPPEDDLHQSLSSLAQQHPGVVTTLDGPASNWIQTLIGHSRHASLLVIGSHHSDERRSIRVGLTAGAVLRQATGPIMLIGGTNTAPVVRPEPVDPAPALTSSSCAAPGLSALVGTRHGAELGKRRRGAGEERSVVKPHHLPPTTHTIEMAQIAEFNTGLEADHGPALTAAELGLEGAPLHRRSSSVLPGTAVLIRVAWDGAPEFPDVHAHFAPTVPGASDAVVDLHTAALRRLSHRLGLHHVWGVGNV